MSRRWSVAVGMGAVAALVVGFFALRARLFERAEVEVEVGYRGAAASNPYYGLQELLRELRIPTQSATELLRLPPREGALVLVAPRRGVAAAAADRLLGWVESGGHLVVAQVGNLDGDEVDPVLEPFGVGATQWLKARIFTTSNRLEFSVLRVDEDQRGVWRASFRVKNGLLTVLPDAGFLRNDSLGLADHAREAWSTIAFSRRPRSVLIVYDDPPPSLLGASFRHGHPLVVSLAVLLLAALLAYGRRFGPPLPAQSPERRRLDDHVRAMGHYLWDVGAEHALLIPTQEAASRHFGGPSPAFKVPGAAARAALTLRKTRDRDQLMRTVQALESIRRSHERALFHTTRPGPAARRPIA